MKKAISLLLALVLCLPLCACSGGNETPETTEATEPETSIPAETEPSLGTSWVLDYYVDDFGDKTDTPYIKCVIEGDFSNTATMSSDLTVVIFYDFKRPYELGSCPFSFRLIEYGDHRATYQSDDKITLKMKLGDEVRTSELYGVAPNGDLMFTPADFTVGELLHALVVKDASDVRCIITIGNSQYNFTIPPAGFFDSYKAMDDYYNGQG